MIIIRYTPIATHTMATIGKSSSSCSGGDVAGGYNTLADIQGALYLKLTVTEDISFIN